MSDTDELIGQIIGFIREDEWDSAIALLNGNYDYYLKKYTAVHWAAYYGSTNCMSGLLQAGASTDIYTEDVGRSTPIILATSNKHFDTLSLLLYHNNESVNYTDGQNYSALHYAAQISEPEFVQLLLDFGADPNQLTSFDWNALQLCEDPQSAELLINAGVDINHADKVGNTPLHNAAAKGKLRLLDILLENRANPNAVTQEGITPLMLAAKDGNVETINLLLQHKADPMRVSETQDTALHHAALNGSAAVVRRLIQCSGMDLTAANSDGETAFHLVSTQEAAEVLVQNYSGNINLPNYDANTPLHTVVWTDNVEPEVCQVLIEAGGSLQGKNAKGQTPFILACARGDPYILELLFDAGADIFDTDDFGFSGLHYAAAAGSVDCVRFLIENKLDINQSSAGDHITPLHNTMSAEVALYLLEQGASVAMTDDNGNLPIHKAVERADNVELVNLLLEFNSKLDPKNNDGDSPLHIAATNNHGNCVFLLLQKGASVSLKNNDGYTALHLSLINTSTFCTKLLIDVGSSDLSEPTDKEKWQPLHIVNAQMSANHLLKKRARLDARDANRNTPLHCVCFKGADEIVDIFLARGAPINVANQEGVTPLIFAAQQGYANIVGSLLQAGADANIIDKKQNKAIDYVQKMLDAKSTMRDPELFEDYKACKEWLSQYTKKDLETDAEDRVEEEKFAEEQAKKEADDLERRKIIAKKQWRKLKLAKQENQRLKKDGTVVFHKVVGPVVDGQFRVQLKALRLLAVSAASLDIESMKKEQEETHAKQEALEEHFRVFLQIFDKDEHDEMEKYLVDHDLDPNMTLYSVSLLHEAVSHGAYRCVKSLLEVPGLELDVRDPRNHTPIRIAQINQDRDIFRLLAMAGADLVSEDENGWTLLHHAAATSEEWCKMVLTDWESEPAKIAYGTALNAAKRLLLSKESEAKETNGDAEDAGMAHSRSGRTTSSDSSHTRTSSPEGGSSSSSSGASNASGRTVEDVHTWELPKDRMWEYPKLTAATATMDVNGEPTKFEKWTPLHCASESAVARLLLRLGADINARDDDGNTPIMHLIEQYKSPKELPPKEEERENEKNEEKEVGDQKGKEKEKDGKDSKDSKDGKDGKGKDKDNNPQKDEETDKDKDEGSSSSSSNKEDEPMSLERKLELEEREEARKEEDERERLATLQDVPLLEALLKHEPKADLSLRNAAEDTALHMAVRVQSLDYVKLLLKHDAMTALTDKDGMTPVHIAAQLGNSAILAELIQYSFKELDAFKRATGRPTKTPLHLVKDVRCGEQLAEVAADFGWLTAIDTAGRTALHEHARRRDNETAIIQALLDAGAPVEGHEVVQEIVPVDTPLMMVCAKGKAAKVDLLLDYEAIPFLVNKQGKMALHFAVSSCNQECVKLVLAAMSKASLRKATTTMGMVPAAWQRSIPTVDPPNCTIRVAPGNFTLPHAYRGEDAEKMRQELRAALAEKLRLKERKSEEAERQERQRRKQLATASKYVEAASASSGKDGNDSKTVPPEEDTEAPRHLKILQDVISDSHRPLLVDTVTTFEQWSPLHLAKTSGIVRLLVQAGANVNIVDSNGMRPVHIAAATGLHDVLADLINMGGAAVNSAEKERTPLMLAAQAGHMECVQLLLEKGADVYASDEAGQSASEYATNAGLEEIAVYLDSRKVLDPSSKLYQRNDDVQEHRQVAVRRRPAKVVERKKKRIYHTKGSFLRFMSSMLATKFLVRGFSERRPDPMGLYAATRANDAVTFKRILQDMMDDDPGAELNPVMYGWPLLHWACFHGAYKVVRAMLDYKVEVDSVDSNATTPLCWACFGGFHEIVRLLLSRGANPHAVDTLWGAQPLHFAAQGASPECIAMLLERDVDHNALTNVHGYTPMHFVSSRACAELLQVAGADMDMGSHEGLSPLHTAARFGRYEVLEFLLEIGIDVDAHTLEGETALMKSAQYPNHHDCVRLLLGAGSNPNTVNRDGVSALHFATYYDCAQSVVHLVEAGAKLNVWDRKLLSPLHNACSAGNFDTVQLLLSKPCDADCPDLDGLTPAMRACEMGHFRILKFLVTNMQVDINRATEDGKTMLHIACEFMYWNIASFLLDVGADCTMVDSQGMSPLHVACKHGHVELVNLMLSFGANVFGKDVAGNTPLHFAVFSQLMPFQGKKLTDAEVDQMASAAVEVVRMLVDMQSAPQEANRRGHTPLDMAMKVREMGSKSRVKQIKSVQKKREEVVDILKSVLSDKSRVDVEYKYAERRADYFARIFRDLDELVFHDMDESKVQSYRQSTIFGNAASLLAPGEATVAGVDDTGKSEATAGNAGKKGKAKTAVRYYMPVGSRKRKAVFREDIYHDLLLSLAAQFTQAAAPEYDEEEQEEKKEQASGDEAATDKAQGKDGAEGGQGEQGKDGQDEDGEEEEEADLSPEKEAEEQAAAERVIEMKMAKEARDRRKAAASARREQQAREGDDDEEDEQGDGELDTSALDESGLDKRARAERTRQFQAYQMAMAEKARAKRNAGEPMTPTQMQYLYYVPGMPRMRPHRKQDGQEVRVSHKQQAMQLEDDYEFMSQTNDTVRKQVETEHLEQQKRLQEQHARQLMMMHQQHQQQQAQLQAMQHMFGPMHGNGAAGPGRPPRRHHPHQQHQQHQHQQQQQQHASGQQDMFATTRAMQQQHSKLQRQRQQQAAQQAQRLALEEEHRRQMEHLKHQQKRRARAMEREFASSSAGSGSGSDKRGKDGSRDSPGAVRVSVNSASASASASGGLPMESAAERRLDKELDETPSSARWGMLHEAQQYRHSMMEGKDAPRPPKKTKSKPGIYAQVQGTDFAYQAPVVRAPPMASRQGQTQQGGLMMMGGTMPSSSSPSSSSSSMQARRPRTAPGQAGGQGQGRWVRPVSRAGQAFVYTPPTSAPMQESRSMMKGTSFGRTTTGRSGSTMKGNLVNARDLDEHQQQGLMHRGHSSSSGGSPRRSMSSRGDRVRPSRSSRASSSSSASSSASMRRPKTGTSSRASAYDPMTGRRLRKSSSVSSTRERERKKRIVEQKLAEEEEKAQQKNDKASARKEEGQGKGSGGHADEDGDLDWFVPDLRTEEDLKEVHRREAHEQAAMRRAQEAQMRARQQQMRYPPPTPESRRMFPAPHVMQVRDPYAYMALANQRFHIPGANHMVMFGKTSQAMAMAMNEGSGSGSGSGRGLRKSKSSRSSKKKR